MTRSTTDDNSVLLVHAYLDGELDPANALGIAQQMSTEPALAAESERVKALQRLIHERLPREEAPPGLRARIEASVGGLRRQHAQPLWRALAASFAFPTPRAAVMARACGIHRLNRHGRQQLDLVRGRVSTGNHDRGLARLRPHSRADGTGTGRRGVVGPPYREAVVQWPYSKLATRCRPRQGRLPADWGAHRRGWPDACLDVGLSPCQASYQPHRDASREQFQLDRAPPTVNGYNVVHWIENGVSYWAISDLAPKELEDLLSYSAPARPNCKRTGRAPCQ